MRRLALLLALALAGCPSNHKPPGPNPTPTPGPTPEPTPRPTPRPTATPTPWPVNAEAPRPTVYKYPSGQCPSSGFAGSCSLGCGFADCRGGYECNCRGAGELSAGISNLQFQVIDRCLDQQNDPRTVFTSGGSENIPVSMRIVKYLKDRDPKWFEAYFDIQLTGEFPVLARREMQSGSYIPVTAGNVLVAHKLAQRFGHAELERKSALWLRTYWTTLALQATQGSVRTYKAWHFNERLGVDVFDAVANDMFGNYGLALAGCRCYVNGSSACVGLQGVMLSMALDHPDRKFGGVKDDWNLDTHSGRPICGPAKILFYPYSNKTGRVSLKSVTPDAADFGLTAQERWILKQYVLSNGTTYLDTLLGWIAPYRFAGEWTILRTDRGITSAFVKFDGAHSGGWPDNKGGSYVAATMVGDTLTSLSRSTHDAKPEAVEVWTEGGQVCAQTKLRPKKCIDIITGNVVSMLCRNKDGHLVRC